MQIVDPVDLLNRFSKLADGDLVKLLAVCREWVCLCQKEEESNKELRNAFKYEGKRVKNQLVLAEKYIEEKQLMFDKEKKDQLSSLTEKIKIQVDKILEDLNMFMSLPTSKGRI